MKGILIDEDPVPCVEGALDHLIALVLTAALNEVIRDSLVTNQMRLVKGTKHHIFGIGTRVYVDVVDGGHGTVGQNQAVLRHQTIHFPMSEWPSTYV